MIKFETIDELQAGIVHHGSYLTGYVFYETEGLGIDFDSIAVLGGVTWVSPDKVGIDFNHPCVERKTSIQLMMTQLNKLSGALVGL